MEVLQIKQRTVVRRVLVLRLLLMRNQMFQVLLQLLQLLRLVLRLELPQPNRILVPLLCKLAWRNSQLRST
jgi:hypothetical protein